MEMLGTGNSALLTRTQCGGGYKWLSFVEYTMVYQLPSGFLCYLCQGKIGGASKSADEVGVFILEDFDDEEH